MLQYPRATEVEKAEVPVKKEVEEGVEVFIAGSRGRVYPNLEGY